MTEREWSLGDYPKHSPLAPGSDPRSEPCAPRPPVEKGANAKCYSRFFINALPEADFRYRSRAVARSESERARYVLIRHGLHFAVCGTRPALCWPNLARRSDVLPM